MNFAGMAQQGWGVAQEVLWVEESWRGHSLLNGECNASQEGELCNEEPHVAPAIDMPAQTTVPRCHCYLPTPLVPKHSVYQ